MASFYPSFHESWHTHSLWAGLNLTHTAMHLSLLWICSSLGYVHQRFSYFIKCWSTRMVQFDLWLSTIFSNCFSGKTLIIRTRPLDVLVRTPIDQFSSNLESVIRKPVKCLLLGSFPIALETEKICWVPRDKQEGKPNMIAVKAFQILSQHGNLNFKKNQRWIHAVQACSINSVQEIPDGHTYLQL